MNSSEFLTSCPLAATFNRGAYEIVKTWANWDSVKEEVLAVRQDRDEAEKHAERLDAEFDPWSAVFVRERRDD